MLSAERQQWQKMYDSVHYLQKYAVSKSFYCLQKDVSNVPNNTKAFTVNFDKWKHSP